MVPALNTCLGAHPAARAHSDRIAVSHLHQGLERLGGAGLLDIPELVLRSTGPITYACSRPTYIDLRQQTSCYVKG